MASGTRATVAPVAESTSANTAPPCTCCAVSDTLHDAPTLATEASEDVHARAAVGTVTLAARSYSCSTLTLLAMAWPSSAAVLMSEPVSLYANTPTPCTASTASVPSLCRPARRSVTDSTASVR